MKARLITALCIIASAASARIGETPHELVARFGRPVSKTIDGPVFEKDGMRIKTSGYQGRCISITYQAKSALINDAQIQHFLSVNDLGGGWKKERINTAEPSYSAWNSSDGRYRAVYTGSSFSVSDHKLLQEKQRDQDAARASATAGF